MGEIEELFEKVKTIVMEHCDGTMSSPDDPEKWNFSEPEKAPSAILEKIHKLLYTELQ